MKTSTILLSLLACAGMYAADTLPAEIKNAPKDKVIDVTSKIYAKERRQDKDANKGTAGVMIRKGKDGKPYTSLNCGVYCRKYNKRTHKVNNFLCIKPIPQDEKYHWYKIPLQREEAAVVEERTILYMGDETMGVSLRDYKGKFEYWISLKFQGPSAVAGSKSPDGIYFDQAILIRK